MAGGATETSTRYDGRPPARMNVTAARPDKDESMMCASHREVHTGARRAWTRPAARVHHGIAM